MGVLYAPNRSSAVMQQRTEARDALDDFPTPPWATRALCEWLVRKHGSLEALTCREPAANRGHMVRPLAEYFAQVQAADVHDYGAGYAVEDYLFGPLAQKVDWTITNPPFRLAEAFIDRALQTSRLGVAMILRTAFLEGISRYEHLFSKAPPCDVLQFTQRVVMHKGRLSPKGASATAYAWFVWDCRSTVYSGRGGTVLSWIPPCRKSLERACDYQGGADGAPQMLTQGKSQSNKDVTA